MYNFSRLNTDIVVHLFKTYCCNCYGSYLTLDNIPGFIKRCTDCNETIRIFFNTHLTLTHVYLDQY